jgi:hypothetical protein
MANPKYKIRKQWSEEMNQRMADSTAFEDKVDDKRLGELNKIYSNFSKLPDPSIAPEQYYQAISAGLDKMLVDITTSSLGRATSSLMYAALLVATLPVTLGQAASIHWEKSITRFIRKAERPELLAATDYIQAFYRGKLKIEEMKDKLKLIGLPDTEIEYLQRLTEVIPSASDIISFAVREAYSPDIVARFGQYEGADEIFAVAETDIKAVGMSKETFSKYWAAHWALPSIQQGYEMLQRGVITDSDLAMLMRAADIMPFWRDKLKAISYVPLTRVDVRRMNKMGILNKAQVIIAYKNIGYNQRDAELMTEFTLQYNNSPEAAEQTEADKTKAANKDLTKADITRNYELGLITRSQAVEYLGLIGYDTSETDFLMSREDYLLEEKRLDSGIKYLKEAYTKGIINKVEAAQELGKLAITSVATDNYLRDWELDRSVKIATPSRADIMSFLAKGIISTEIAKSELSKLGYSDTYIDWYFKSAVTKVK